jgi:hypothetical protein
MRYLMIHKIDESRPEASNPSPEFQAAMGAFMQECAESGVLLAAEGVTQSKDGAVLRKTEAGAVTVTDGPFTEAREVVGGFAVVKVESREQALELAQRFMALFEDVSVEVRRIHEFEDLQPQS